MNEDRATKVKEHKERQERIAEEKANIQRLDARNSRFKKYWGLKNVKEYLLKTKRIDLFSFFKERLW